MKGEETSTQTSTYGPQAAERLLPLVYKELRKLAAARLRNESPNHTLQATALVHEAYLRLIAAENRRGGDVKWDHKGHFFAAAARAMQRILVEHARSRSRRKRGGGRKRIELDSAVAIAKEPDAMVLALDELLEKLATHDPQKAEIVRLRYFAGLTVSEAAQVLGISKATAERHWSFARSWLYCRLNDAEHDGEKNFAGP